MALFKKKGRIIDLTENYRRQQGQIPNSQSNSEIVDLSPPSSTLNSQNSNSSFGGFFGSGITSPSSENQSTQVFGETVNPEERRRKLAKRLTDITEKLEDISNQIYHLQQRIEVLERKARV